MQTFLKLGLTVVGAAVLVVPALAQQGNGPPPGAQGGPGAQAGQGAPGGGPGAGGPPRQGQGGPGGGGGGRPGGGGGGGFGGPPPAPNTGVAVFADLKGGEGSGKFTAVIDPPKGQICYMMNVNNLTATGAHIHTGGPGASGPVAVPLETPANGTSGACAPIAAALAQQILANPGGYYVNVHTAAQPGGAIRGQLSK